MIDSLLLLLWSADPLPDRNAEMFNYTFKALRSFAIVNLLSAIHESTSS